MSTPADFVHHIIEVQQIRKSTALRGPRVDEYRITVTHVDGAPVSDAFLRHIAAKLYPLPTSGTRANRRHAYAEAIDVLAPGVCRLRIVAPTEIGERP